MYTLLEQINDHLKEAIDARRPVLKIVLISGDSSKVIDVQHLNVNNIVGDALKVIRQNLAQFKSSRDMNFSSEEHGLFNNLELTINLDETNKVIQIEVSSLTLDDIKTLKMGIIQWIQSRA